MIETTRTQTPLLPVGTKVVASWLGVEKVVGVEFKKSLFTGSEHVYYGLKDRFGFTHSVHESQIWKVVSR